MAQFVPENALLIPKAKTFVRISKRKTHERIKLLQTSESSKIVLSSYSGSVALSWQYWNNGTNIKLRIETTVIGTSAQYLFWYRIAHFRHSEYSSFSICYFSIPVLCLYLSLFMIRFKSPGSSF